MTSDSELVTPVVLLIFNRPDTTAQVFAEVAKARPARLLVVADGPRSDHPEDMQQCAAARAVVEQVDWDCVVSSNYAETNLGLRQRVVSGLNWAFDLVEEAIILEDDCVPHPDFFSFCTRMIEWYRDDDRVMMVSGTNYVADRLVVDHGYFFCRYFAIWGWATWRRAWEKYDDQMTEWGDLRTRGILRGLCANQQQVDYLAQMFDGVMTKEVDTWDIPWFYSCLMNYGLAATPGVNLVMNIGVSGTHTGRKASPTQFLPTAPLLTADLTLRRWVFPHVAYEQLLYTTVLKRPWHIRLLKKMGILDLAVTYHRRYRAII